MNILQIQDDLKNFSEQQLINEMQRPSGNAPQYLVLSEINRRKRVKEDYQANQPMDTQTVAEEAVASAGVPMSGIAGMAEAMAPKSESSLVAPKTPPMQMREGGEVDYYAGGGLIEGIAESVSSNADSLKALQGVALQNAGLLQDIQNAGNPQATAPTPVPVQQPTPAPITPRPITPSFPSFPSRPYPATPFPFPFRGQVGIGGKGRPRSNVRNMLGTNMLAGLGSYAGQVQPQAMAEGGVVRAANGLPLGMRNFNLGNIRPGAGFIGETGSNKGYATFENPMFGGRALARLLNTYGSKYGIDNINNLVERYAPEGDNPRASIENYKKFLSKKTGLGSDEKFDLSKDKGKLMQAIFEFETGQDSPFSQDDINKMIKAAGSDDEKEVRNILSKSKKDYGKDSGETGIMSAEAGTLDDKKVPERIKGLDKEKSTLEKILTTKIPGSEYIDPITPIYNFGKKNIEPFLEDYIYGKKIGGKEKPLLDMFKGPKIKEYEEKQALKNLIDQEAALDTADDKILDTEGGVGGAEGEVANVTGEFASIVNAQNEANKTKPKDDTGKDQPLTLDDQLASMQEDLKKSRDQDKWLAIAQAGLSIMASDKPTLGGAIGEGAGAGLQAYRDAQERYNEGVIDVLNARAKLRKGKDSFSRKDALSAINSNNTQITRLLADKEGIFDDKEKEKINEKIKNLEFQNSQLLPLAGIIARKPISKQTYMGS